jgi:hypothetical protein
MEAPEVPTEHLHEEMHEHAEHAGKGERWTLGVALSSAIIAGLAAIGSLLAGMNANEAMVDQMQASDKWEYYQAKGTKWGILNSKVEILTALGKETNPQDIDKLASYKKEQDAISKVATAKEASSKERFEAHESLAFSVTMFQVAIAVAAISVLTKRRPFWYTGLVASLIGIIFLSQGLIRMKRLEAESAETSSEAGANAAEKPSSAGHPAPTEKPEK